MSRPMKGYIYLAVPYSHKDPVVRMHRYHAVCLAAAKLMEMGYVIFSPITHTIPIESYVKEDMKLDHSFWMEQDLPILAKAAGLFILTLPGWKTSSGVQEEIEFAQEHHIPYQCVSYKDCLKKRIVWDY